MVYNTQNHFFFFLLRFPSCCILENRKHNVSETGLVTEVSRCLSPPLRTESDPVSETSRFLFSRISDYGKSKKKKNSSNSEGCYYVCSCEEAAWIVFIF
jgi:hypothetical protein